MRSSVFAQRSLKPWFLIPFEYMGKFGTDTIAILRQFCDRVGVSAAPDSSECGGNHPGRYGNITPGLSSQTATMRGTATRRMFLTENGSK